MSADAASRQCAWVRWEWLFTSGPQPAQSNSGFTIPGTHLSPKLVPVWAASLITAVTSLDSYLVVIFIFFFPKQGLPTQSRLALSFLCVTRLVLGCIQNNKFCFDILFCTIKKQFCFVFKDLNEF